MSNSIIKPTLIFSASGRRVGSVRAGVFSKTIHGSRHILRFPFPAISFDLETLDQAERAGARLVVVTDADTAVKYRAQLAEIRAGGFPVNRGRGPQWAFSLARFEASQAKGKQPVQLALFGGKA